MEVASFTSGPASESNSQSACDDGNGAGNSADRTRLLFILFRQFKTLEGPRARILDDHGLMIWSIEDQAFVGHDLERQLDRMHGRATHFLDAQGSTVTKIAFSLWVRPASKNYKQAVVFPVPASRLMSKDQLDKRPPWKMVSSPTMPVATRLVSIIRFEPKSYPSTPLRSEQCPSP